MIGEEREASYHCGIWEICMRWLLVVYLVLPNGTAPLPLAIPQSTEMSCGKAAEKLRKDIQGQNASATVITSCIDQGSVY